jgi:hypothetical protein
MIIYHFNFEQNKHKELYEMIIHNRGYDHKSHAVMFWAWSMMTAYFTPLRNEFLYVHEKFCRIVLVQSNPKQCIVLTFICPVNLSLLKINLHHWNSNILLSLDSTKLQFTP